MIAWEDWNPFGTYEPRCGNCGYFKQAGEGTPADTGTCSRSGRTVKASGLCEHHTYGRTST